MNPRNTAILLAVTLGLGAFVYFYEVEGEAARSDAADAEKRVFQGFESGDVEAFALTTEGGEKARIERGDAGWQMLEPVLFPADAVNADAVASALTDLASEGRVSDPQAPEIYGLGEEARLVRFRVEGADQELRIGSKTPVGANSYVAVEGQDAVFMVPTWRLNALTRELRDLRERKVLPFDREAVQAIDARWSGGAVRIVKDGESWRLVSPLEVAADASTVETLLSDLSFLRADGFVDAPTPEALASLEEPAFAVSLELTDDASKETRRAEFALGAEVEDGVRLARGAQPSLYQLPHERLSDFPREVVAYRFKELSRFESSDAVAFELDFESSLPAGETLVIRGERGDGGWQTGPEAMAEGKAGELISKLASLQASDIVAESASEAELLALGLAPPRARFRVYGKHPEEEEGKAPLLADVAIGDFDEGIAARAGDQAIVYRLDGDLAEQLPVSLEAFRNRFLDPEPADEGAAGTDDPGFSQDPALLDEE